MVATLARPDALLEASVLVFQCLGVSALIFSRLSPGLDRSLAKARLVFLLALIGLGISGSACSSFDSEYALFAGGTMTFLLVGMTLPTRGPEPASAALTAFRVNARDF